MISVLLAAYKSEELLKKVFLPSYFANSNPKIKKELVICDNGGNGDLQKLQESVPPNVIKIIGTQTNIGLNAALNQCAKASSGEYFYLPHTDMYLLPKWDISLIDATKNLVPNSFLFCSRSIEPGFSHIKSQIIKNYGNEVTNFQPENLMKEYKQYLEKGIVFNARMPFFLHRKLWDKMNGVDPHYFSFATDDDLIQSAYDCGVRRFYMIYDSLVYHLQGKSNIQQSVDRDTQEPYDYFISKWKSKYSDIHHPGQYHPKLIPFETRIK